VAISRASPVIFSSLGWSTGILRADRASARTGCPARSAAFTVSRPVPLLAPMIKTVAAVMLLVGLAWLPVICDVGSGSARCTAHQSERILFGEIRSPAEMAATTVTTLRCPRALARRTQKPVSATRRGLPALLPCQAAKSCRSSHFRIRACSAHHWPGAAPLSSLWPMLVT
jgi:hypothetical protein